MLPEHIRAVADAWWAQDFGCRADELRPDAIRVQAHAGRLLGDPGTWILCVGEAPLVSLPSPIFEQAAAHVRSWTRASAADAEVVAAALSPYGGGKVIGPAFIGYAAAAPTATSALTVRELTTGDAAAVQRLQESCVPIEWQHGGSALGEVPVFGSFNRDSALAAIAGYEVWSGSIAHIAVVTAPEYRGRGFGRAAVVAATRHALAAGLAAQYRTLASNLPSMQIAQQLAFQEYGFSVYVRPA